MTLRPRLGARPTPAWCLSPCITRTSPRTAGSRPSSAGGGDMRAAGQHGFTLIEFMLALVIAAIVVGALNGVVELALKARTAGREDNELVYQGQFAMARMIGKARASA